MNPQKNKDEISLIMNNPELVQKILQSAINDALLKHKQAGNPVCGFQNGKVFWIAAKDILVGKK
jgi:hypothetical protein